MAMKNLVRHSTVLFVISLAFSCSDDFLKDELEHVSPENASIIISPDWPAQDYPIYCPDVGNANFKVVQAPSWLKISSPSWQFTNGFATLNCKANAYDDFSEVGIYYTYITLAIEGKGNQTILVAYINEGNPVIETELSYDAPSKGRISVRNTGNGILFCSLSRIPEWLLLVDIYGSTVAIEDYHGIILPPNGESIIYFSFDNPPTILFWENIFGKIGILTNDKNKQEVEVEVQLYLGNPLLHVYYSNYLDFGQTETIKDIYFSNQGEGLLVWRLTWKEGRPNWLTVSESQGTLSFGESKLLTFTCDRNLLPYGINTTTVYLESNDRNYYPFYPNPLYPFTVTAHNH